MKLSKLHIQNFKSFENITINLNQDINIFTGVNNAGKSTVLEAMALWCECFNLLIKQSLRVQPKLNIAKGDYKLGDQTNLFPYNQIISVRSPNFEDIFYNLDTSKIVTINSTVVNDEKNNIDIGFSITRGNGGNYQIVLVNYSEFNYKKFNDFFNNFPNPINIIYASPINSLLPYEEFQTLPKISNKVKCRESLSVLRNRLYQLKKSAQLFPEFLKDLSYILTDGLEEIAFTMLGDEHKDVSLDINIRIGGKDIFKSLSLLGSGTLQMIEILLSLYEDSKELQIVLLDEPDSHIHRDIQKRLLYILTNHTKGTQIFLTTHNESLIRSSKPDHLFYLEKNIKTKIYNPIVSNELTTKKVGLQSSHHIKILKELGSETGLDIINALEADRLFLVEGSTDARAIEIILSQKFIDHKYNIMYWVFDGIDSLLPKLNAYKDFLSQIKNGKSLWDKSVLIFDRDYLTDVQSDKLQSSLENDFKIKTFIWDAYTMESLLIKNKSNFQDMLYYILTVIHKKIVDRNDFNIYTNQIIESYITEKLSLLNNDVQHLSIFNTLKNRNNNIEKALPKSKILCNDSELYINFKKYAKSLLEDGHLHHLLDKKDIKDIITKILSTYDIHLSETENEFEYIISNINRGLWIDDWNNLIRLIEH